ncbi:BTAD domain-containing putative transcriptional regulator [Sporosarcina aquimarina]|uniref:BTAD domain-containing putative transcriptional regulator n=1 Tax=Sporosarcina aquimarina TaxID=114975 RepID=A0ABU4FVG7_9BACL|nr:BTAD domain-containing putative transcriptional regulator [Sporosarcina aquimarina]MDW0108709.1 BTAD domain-containing putative transcriptional regulator [Sporosarcina aquimarina]
MIRALIVDDEHLALQHLEKQLQKTGNVLLVAKYSNTTSFLKDLKRLEFDVAFIDIEMPGLSGLDLADLITDWNPYVIIVFVTAFRDYAVQAFELDSTDYLLKPVIQERLEKTIQRIQSRLDVQTIEKESLLTNSQSNSVQITCFNEFNVYHHDEVVKWKTVKVKELFGLLLSQLNKHVQRDVIIESLWPDIEFERAKIQLHTTMSYLRKKLTTWDNRNTVHFSHGSYVLNLFEFDCDVNRFQEIVETSPNVTDDNIGQFEKAVEEYTGDYMETNGYEWAVPIATALRQKLVHVLQLMVDYYAKNEIHNKQHHYLQLLVTHNPYSDYATQQLMQLYVSMGNRGEALKVYNRMKELLIDELGISPEPSVTKLYQTLKK